jgi:HPt (histidine-containing phosphotransfer) domain-containing protein
MMQPSANKTYVFSEHVNVPYLSDLYSGDYEMIEETYSDVLAEFPSLLENIDAAWIARDLSGLKRAVHKIKPLFGFTGLTAIQTQCLDFENACDAHPSFDSILPIFSILKDRIVQAQAIIAEEKARLAIFNSR